MKISEYLKSLIRACCYAMLGIYLFAGILILPSGGENVQMLAAYDVDEVLQMSLMRQNLANSNLDQGEIYDHGTVVQTISYGLMRLYEKQFSVRITETHMIVLMRLVSLLFYGLFLFLVYRLAKRALKMDRTFAILATLTVASLPVVYYYGTCIHPDTAQWALLALAFAVTLEIPTFKGALAASAILGVSAAAKMGSLYALPFMPLPYLADRTSSLGLKEALKPKELRLATITAGLCVLVFLVLFGVWTPYAVIRPVEFVQHLAVIKNFVTRANGPNSDPGPLAWLGVVYRELGTPRTIELVVGLALGALLSWRHARNAQDTRKLNNRLILGSYCLFTSLALLQVRMRAPHYMIHILFALLLLSFAAFSDLVAQLRQSWLKWIVYGLAGYVALSSAVTTFADVGTTLLNRSTGDPVVATLWIQEHFSANTPILFDHYTYRPPSLLGGRNDTVAFRLTDLLRSDEFRLIVLSKSGAGRFAWKKKGTRFLQFNWEVDPTEPHTAIFAQALKTILSPGSPWNIAFENDEILILERSLATQHL